MIVLAPETFRPIHYSVPSSDDDESDSDADADADVDAEEEDVSLGVNELRAQLKPRSEAASCRDSKSEKSMSRNLPVITILPLIVFCFGHQYEANRRSNPVC